MKIAWLSFPIAVCLWSLPEKVSSALHETCEREWEKVGCFRDKKGPNNSLRTLKNILITDRDPTMRTFSGQLIDWHNWKAYVHGFACRCAAAAKAKGYKYFGLQFGGECWAGPDEETRYNMYGAGSKCFDHLSNPLQPCDNKIQDECMGLQHENYIYRLKQDGGYTPWPPWSECPVTCGTGIQMRRRSCTNPAPFKGGKDCSDLGPSSETKECNTEPYAEILATNEAATTANTKNPTTFGMPFFNGPSPCNRNAFDLGIAVDVSTSIGEEHFELVNSFLKKFVSQFDIGPDETHVGLLVYSTQVKLLHSPTDPKFQSVAAQAKAAENAPYLRGGTRTDRALVKANEWFFNDEADRANVPNVLIVLTDGNTNRASQPYWKVLAPLKEKNVKIMAVGVGQRVDDVELKIIALDDDKNVLHVSRFDQLIANMGTLMDAACSKNG